MHLTEVGVGTATFTMPITGWLQVPRGTITGSVVAILADGPLGCAVHTALPAATGYTTTELSINMVRPARSEEQLIARGRLVHASRQLGLTEVFVTDHDGRLIAHGTSRCAISAPDPSIGPPPADIPVVPRAADDWKPPFQRPVVGAILGEENLPNAERARDYGAVHRGRASDSSLESSLRTGASRRGRRQL